MSSVDDFESFVSDVFNEIETAGAVMTMEEMQQFERLLQENGVARRAHLAVLTKPWAEINESIVNNREGAEAIANVLECLDVEFYQDLAKFVQEAKRRMLLSLCGREDMEEILEQAKIETGSNLH